MWRNATLCADIDVTVIILQYVRRGATAQAVGSFRFTVVTAKEHLVCLTFQFGDDQAIGCRRQEKAILGDVQIAHTLTGAVFGVT